MKTNYLNKLLLVAMLIITLAGHTVQVSAEEPVQDELAAAVEQLQERPSAVGPLEGVVPVNPDHRHPFASCLQLEHRAGHSFLALEKFRQSGFPRALLDDRWAGNSRRLIHH